MDSMNISTVRAALNSRLDAWRTDESQRPIFVGAYGTQEAVLVPMAVWQQMIAIIADGWDLSTAAVRAGRVDDPAGARPLSLAELADVAGRVDVLVPVLPSRGVPRGAPDLAAWPAALEDLHQLASSHPAAAATAARAVAELLQGRGDPRRSAAGRGMTYWPADVDGLGAVVLTCRRHARPGGRRSGHEVLELVGADRLTWAPDMAG